MINSNTEWGTLKEVILGTAVNASIPTIKGKDIHCVDYAHLDDLSNTKGGNYAFDVIAQTQDELDVFSQNLTSIGISVLRPQVQNTLKVVSTPDWKSDGYYYYCPRDSILIVGDTIIETPMPLRSRYYETNAYKDILHNYFLNGAKWISAPRPRLLDDLYNRTDLSKPTLTETEIAFDAANVIRCGKDLFYLVSNSGNRLGAQWLQSTLGDKYRVHVMDNIYAYVHVDTSILPLAPGKVLLNPERINKDNLPKYFNSWEKIWSPVPTPTDCDLEWASGSPWIGMNVLSLSETLVAVEARQTKLMRLLERHGFDIMPVKLTHCRTLSGGPHCVTLDTIREDHYADYS